MRSLSSLCTFLIITTVASVFSSGCTQSNFNKEERALTQEEGEKHDPSVPIRENLRASSLLHSGLMMEPPIVNSVSQGEPKVAMTDSNQKLPPGRFQPVKETSIIFKKFTLGLPVFLSAGASHSCAVFGDGKVKCWGDNGAGQLGNKSYETSFTPTQVLDANGVLVKAARLVGGFEHTCAILNDETVSCWGNNAWRQLGFSSKTSSVNFASPVPNVTDVKTMAAAQHHSCALLNNGTLQCWGNNEGHEVNEGATTYDYNNDFYFPPTLVTVNGQPLGGIASVAAGYYYTCALMTDGTISCSSPNGIGRTYNIGTSNPQGVSLDGITDAVEIAGGWFHACALLKDGTVQCWGLNEQGQLGNGTWGDKNVWYPPSKVPELNDVIEIAAGENHTCALIKDGTVRCWGDNSVGQLGSGDTASRYGRLGSGGTASSNKPVSVVDLKDVQQVVAGGAHNCALLSAGTVKCWGANFSGQLGSATNLGDHVSRPTEVQGL